MRLSCEWTNCHLSEGQRFTAEAIYVQTLVDTFGSVESAKRQKEDYLRRSEPPGHPWRYGKEKAIEYAIHDAPILPSERHAVHFVEIFEP